MARKFQYFSVQDGDGLENDDDPDDDNDGVMDEDDELQGKLSLACRGHSEDRRGLLELVVDDALPFLPSSH